ncbi:MAG: UDP-glucose/GDP-mannose dehydrogenase family protein [Candidatus Competibacterales bacterium]|nr:UDP-glucose/GDP-mannose dehydrogenase family protein [Candidatus Competibacterales bacterium]
MKLTLYGSGYVGLVTGACLAEVGNHVICVDIDAERVERLRRGEVPIHEPGLDDIIAETTGDGRLRFTTDAAEGVAHGRVQMIAVGTPPDEDGSADLRHVLAVAREIGRHLDDYRVVVTKSTVPVGTADRVRAELAAALDARGLDHDFDVVSNPEFLKEGAAVQDFTRPDRVVIGTDSTRAEALMRELYAPFNRNRDRLLIMDIRSAELTKYAANAMLATKISFMNEMAAIAERLDADIEQVRIGIGADPRIGFHFIYPGIGYGGSCFPKDVRALVHTARQAGLDSGLLDAVELRNAAQKQWLYDQLSRQFEDRLEGLAVALWGLAFKPDTDDMREAPSRVLMEALWTAGARVRAYDPAANAECLRIYGERADLLLCDDPYQALEGADALVICTEWREFRSPDFETIARTLKRPLIVDGRNLYDPQRLAQAGIHYRCVGRPADPPDA